MRKRNTHASPRAYCLFVFHTAHIQLPPWGLPALLTHVTTSSKAPRSGVRSTCTGAEPARTRLESSTRAGTVSYLLQDSVGWSAYRLTKMHQVSPEVPHAAFFRWLRWTAPAAPQACPRSAGANTDSGSPPSSAMAPPWLAGRVPRVHCSQLRAAKIESAHASH